MIIDDEIFGDADQIALQRRAMALWDLVKDDRRFGFPGRFVSVLGDRDGSLECLISLARLQGASVAHFFPAASHADAQSRIAQQGLKSGRWEMLWGREAALAKAHHLIAARPPPPGVVLTEVDSDTPVSVLNDAAALMADSGVMPVPGSLMRGGVVPGVMLIASNQAGEVVSTAQARLIFNSRSHRATEAFWGLLATRDDQRGKGLALYLGALVMVRAAERFGATGFMTGVAADNEPSNALCARLGVAPSDYIGLACTDPTTFKRDALTK